MISASVGRMAVVNMAIEFVGGFRRLSANHVLSVMRLPAVPVATIDSDLTDLRDSNARCDISGHENLACIEKRCRKVFLIDLPNPGASIRKRSCVLIGVRESSHSCCAGRVHPPNPTDA